jgi:hypothetical protein
VKVRLTIDLDVGDSWRGWVTAVSKNDGFQVEADDLVDLIEDRDTKDVELIEAAFIVGGHQFR